MKYKSLRERSILSRIFLCSLCFLCSPCFLWLPALLLPDCRVVWAQAPKPHALVAASATSVEKSINFPDHPVGTLTFTSQVGDQTVTKKAGPAHGLVKVPSHTKVELSLNFDGVSNLSFLSKLKPDDLQTLSFDGDAVENGQFKWVPHLADLESLSFTEVDLTDKQLEQCLKELKNMKHLSSLVLDRTLVTDTGVTSIVKNLPHLQVLLLLHDAITDKGVEQLKDLRSLSKLQLGATHLSDKGVVTLAGLSSLTSLGLQETNVTDGAAASLAKISSLSELNLSKTGITDAGVQALASLPSLKILKISLNHISNNGVKSLIKLKHLHFLDITATDIDREHAKAIQAALPKCHIFWAPNFRRADPL